MTDPAVERIAEAIWQGLGGADCMSPYIRRNGNDVTLDGDFGLHDIARAVLLARGGGGGRLEARASGDDGRNAARELVSCASRSDGRPLQPRNAAKRLRRNARSLARSASRGWVGVYVASASYPYEHWKVDPVNISMNEEQMTALVSKAIFDGLTQEAKDEMLQKALRHLMTKDERSYGYGLKRTPLEEAMQQSAFAVARKIAEDRIASDEGFKANIEALFIDLGKALFESPLRAKLVETMADSVVSNLQAGS